MKDYKNVVEEHFDQDVAVHSIYDKDHPVGRYSAAQLHLAIKNTLNHLFSTEKLAELHLLDLGCGSGAIIQLLLEYGFDPNNVTGVDLSEKRIEKAKSLIPTVHYETGDVLTYTSTTAVDLITAFDLLSHLKTEGELTLALSNIYNQLGEKGIFIWYDIFSQDHFSPPYDAISWGFNRHQMIELARTVGLRPIYQKTLFKRFFGKYHSVYQAKRIPGWLLRFCEIVLPGSPGNLIIAFQK